MSRLMTPKEWFISIFQADYQQAKKLLMPYQIAECETERKRHPHLPWDQVGKILAERIWANHVMTRSDMLLEEDIIDGYSQYVSGRSET